MRNALAIAIFTLGLLALASAGHAESCDGDAIDVAAHIFDMSDANEDGLLSPDEFADAGLERYGVPFDDFDVNGDGATSFDEYLDLFEYHHPPQDVI